MARVSLHHRAQQRRERLLVLQFPQAWRVGRTHVDHEIIHVGMHRVHACEVVLHRPVVGCDLVLANVAPDNQPFRPADQTRHRWHQPLVVEPHPVEDAFVLHQTKKPGLGVARLRPRRHRANLHKPKAEQRQGVKPLRILVEPCGQTHLIGKLQSSHLNLLTFILLTDFSAKPPRHTRNA